MLEARRIELQAEMDAAIASGDHARITAVARTIDRETLECTAHTAERLKRVEANVSEVKAVVYELRDDFRAVKHRAEGAQWLWKVLGAIVAAGGGAARSVVVDVGTGTGAIILSIAAEYKGDAVLAGVDASARALALAKENARLCALDGRVAFIEMDLLEGFDEPESIDLIVSNPPYIESGAIAALDPRIRDWEPRMALDGGGDGLAFYDRILADALNLLKSGGSVLFEIGDTQGAAVRRLLETYGFAQIQIRQDLAGRDRYGCAVLE